MSEDEHTRMLFMVKTNRIFMYFFFNLFQKNMDLCFLNGRLLLIAVGEGRRQRAKSKILYECRQQQQQHAEETTSNT